MKRSRDNDYNGSTLNATGRLLYELMNEPEPPSAQDKINEVLKDDFVLKSLDDWYRRGGGWDIAGRITSDVQLAFRRIMGAVQNAENWKLPTTPVRITSSKKAQWVADAITFFVGGAELERRSDYVIVKSRGYYHYIGA